MTGPEVHGLRMRAAEDALDRLRQEYPECEITRMPDWTIRAKHPDWPLPVRVGTAAELEQVLRQYP